MTAPLSGINHVVILVLDLDRAREAYARLGFTLSPRGDHSPPLGTSNHTIMGRRDYLELLTVTTSTDENRGYREALACGEGIVGVALATPAAASARSAWHALGVRPEEMLRLSRPVDRPGGVPIEARFENHRAAGGHPSGRGRVRLRPPDARGGLAAGAAGPYQHGRCRPGGDDRDPGSVRSDGRMGTRAGRVFGDRRGRRVSRRPRRARGPAAGAGVRGGAIRSRRGAAACRSRRAGTSS